MRGGVARAPRGDGQHLGAIGEPGVAARVLEGQVERRQLARRRRGVAGQRIGAHRGHAQLDKGGRQRARQAGAIGDGREAPQGAPALRGGGETEDHARRERLQHQAAGRRQAARGHLRPGQRRGQPGQRGAVPAEARPRGAVVQRRATQLRGGVEAVPNHHHLARRALRRQPGGGALQAHRGACAANDGALVPRRPRILRRHARIKAGRLCPSKCGRT
jgi:hypothetical protein